MSRASILAKAIGADGILNVGDVAGLAAIASSGSATDLTTGTIPVARVGDASVTLAKLSATGTKDATTFLRGDNSFATVSVTPTAVSDQNNTSTGYFDLPSGTTAQRPASPSVGMQRWNTTIGFMEYYDGYSWTSIQSATYNIDYLIVAGGGSGGSGNGGSGGGGAGGYLAVAASSILSGASLTITIGAGGAATANGADLYGNDGSNSAIIGTGISQTAIGGGGGGAWSNKSGRGGGSGGGGGGLSGGGGSGTSGQGNAGGSGNGSTSPYSGGGGGGAGAVGQTVGSGAVANGGVGLAWLNGSYYAGGGGAGTEQTTYQSQGLGGNGGGGRGGSGNVGNTASGTVNTGGGGGGGGYPTGSFTGYAGGSGVVIIRYSGNTRGVGGTVTSSGGYTYHTFTSSGTYTA